MTDFEQNVLDMMIPKEQDRLLRVLALSSCREGAIVSLIAERLHDMVNSGLMDLLHPELKVEPAAAHAPERGEVF